MGHYAKWVKRGIVVMLGLAVAIQFIPYGRDHSNPEVVAEPAWDSPRTRELAERACFDCHSNETTWPWYSVVAPISWLMQNHVDEGRDELNFSEWHIEQEGEEAASTVRDGSMPTRDYLLTHPDARMTDAELADLAAGFVAMFGDEDDDDEDD